MEGARRGTGRSRGRTSLWDAAGKSTQLWGSGIKFWGSDHSSWSGHNATGSVAQRGLSHTSPELRGLQWGTAEPDGTTGLGKPPITPDQPGADGTTGLGSLPAPQISLELRAGPGPVYLSCQGLPPHTFLIRLVV